MGSQFRREIPFGANYPNKLRGRVATNLVKTFAETQHGQGHHQGDKRN